MDLTVVPVFVFPLHLVQRDLGSNLELRSGLPSNETNPHLEVQELLFFNLKCWWGFGNSENIKQKLKLCRFKGKPPQKSYFLNDSAIKGTVHSSNIWAKSLANGSLIIVL